MKSAFSIAVLVCSPICLVAWLSAVVCMFKTVANLRPEIRLWQDAPWWNPFNHIFFTEHLTEAGLKYRRRLALSALAFAIPILLVMALGAATGQLD